MSTNSIPVGSALLGRVLNANGEPIDRKGNLADAIHVPLYVPGAKSAKAGITSMRVLETGIKVLDLMAPDECTAVNDFKKQAGSKAYHFP